MNTNDTITWTASNGSTIEIHIHEYVGRASAYTSVDGKRDVTARLITLSPPVKSGDAVLTARIGKVGLTQERYDQLTAMLAAKQAEIDSRADVRLAKLVDERRRLAANLAHVLADAHDAQVRRIETASSTGVDAGVVDFSATERAAREELAAFDAAHPDVLATIAAGKADAAARFERAD